MREVQIDDPYLYRLAQVESSLDPRAENPNSSAKGLFQFVDGTAQHYGLDDPFDPEKSIDAASRLTEDNRKVLAKKLGREPTPGELYLAHQQGATGASKLLANPNAKASDIVGRAAVVNNAGDDSISAADFARQWTDKFEEGMVDPYAGDTTSGFMEVELPDGTIIEGVPADMSKEEFTRMASERGYDMGVANNEGDLVDNTSPEGAAPSIASNVVGDGSYDFLDDPLKALDNVGRRVGGALRTFADDFTLGSGDEISAGLGYLGAKAAAGLSSSVDMEDVTWDDALAASRDQEKQIREAYPVQSLITGVAGGVASGVGAAKTAARFAPQKLSALSRMAAQKPVRTAAALGGATGTVQGFNEGEGGVADRALSAVGGGVLGTGGGAAGGKLAAWLTRKAGGGAVDEITESLDDYLVSSQPKAQALSNLTPKQQARSAALEAVGVVPDKQTLGMVSRDPEIWQFEQNTKNVAGIGEEIRNRYINANAMIRGKLDDLGIKIGGKATTSYEAGDSVVDAITSKNREMQAEVGKLYSQVREQVGDNIGMQPNRLLSTLDEASDNAYADSFVRSVANKMKRYGVIDADGLPTGEALSVKNAEELRKFVNKLSGDRQIQHIVSDTINSLDDDVIETAGVDSFRTARDAARARFTEFDKAILQKIGDEKILPDDVINRTAFGGKVRDVQALKESLLTGSDEQMARGAQAWNDYKTQVLQTMIDNSSNLTSETPKISGASFAKQLKRIGDERLNMIFEPEEVLQLKTTRKALEYTDMEVPYSGVNYSNTAAANVNNTLQNVLKESTYGNAITRGASSFVTVPLLGPVASPLAFGAKKLGEFSQQSTMQGNVRRVLNPQKFEALGKLADPATVGALGLLAGQDGGKRAARNLNDSK